MKANLKSIRKKKVYSEEFKKQLVVEFESGKFSVLDLSRLHGINERLVYKWIYKFSTFTKKDIE